MTYYYTTLNSDGGIQYESTSKQRPLDTHTVEISREEYEAKCHALLIDHLTQQYAESNLTAQRLNDLIAEGVISTDEFSSITANT